MRRLSNRRGHFGKDYISCLSISRGHARPPRSDQGCNSSEQEPTPIATWRRAGLEKVDIILGHSRLRRLPTGPYRTHVVSPANLRKSEGDHHRISSASIGRAARCSSCLFAAKASALHRVRCEELFQERICVAVAPQHPLARRRLDALPYLASFGNEIVVRIDNQKRSHLFSYVSVAVFPSCLVTFMAPDTVALLSVKL
jgi:hypothetical protein